MLQLGGGGGGGVIKICKKTFTPSNNHLTSGQKNDDVIKVAVFDANCG